ncbi:hypothetical protein QTP86_001084 [Hemibagrus guttatus]|nr:hypothetical protein QTP86_001084 [Hemibagrus guttatus]
MAVVVNPGLDRSDLEKAYDRVPREELWYCMRKSGVAEKYVRVVQDMYERSRTVVRCAVGQTEEFKVEVGLHQGSALSPFLFAMVMDQLSEEVRQESPCTMMFADDIVICGESREQVEENLERWRFALEKSVVSGWNDPALLAVFREGLYLALQVKMACCSTNTSLSEYITSVIPLANLIHQQHYGTRLPYKLQAWEKFRRPPKEWPDPMRDLCFYCGGSGHHVMDCPENPYTSKVREDCWSSCMMLKVLLHHTQGSVVATALVDSGAAINLIDQHFAERCRMVAWKGAYPLRDTGQ